jgi:hypothetical protein
MAIEATFFKFRPNPSTTSICGIEDKELIDEILRHPDLKDFKRSLDGILFLEVPSDLSNIGMSPELQKMLDMYKGQIIGFNL